MNKNIAHDDLLDIQELTSKLENFMLETFEGHDKRICLSALMGATLNCSIGNCKTLYEAQMLRNIFVSVFDKAIQKIKNI